MNRIKFAVGLLLANTNAVRYKCKFGPDQQGIYVEEEVESGVALNCGDFCECEGLMNNTCHFGPDITGKFLVEIVSSEKADECKAASLCLCDTHEEAITEIANGKTFDQIMLEREQNAQDKSQCRPDCPNATSRQELSEKEAVSDDVRPTDKTGETEMIEDELVLVAQEEPSEAVKTTEEIVEVFPGFKDKKEKVVPQPEELFFDYKTGKVVKSSEVVEVTFKEKEDDLKVYINIGIGVFIITTFLIVITCLIFKARKVQKPKFQIRESFKQIKIDTYEDETPTPGGEDLESPIKRESRLLVGVDRKSLELSQCKLMAMQAVSESVESESCNGEESVTSSVNDQKEDEVPKNPQSEDIDMYFDNMTKSYITEANAKRIRSALIYRHPSIHAKID